MKLSELCDFLASHGFANEIDGAGDLSINAVNTIEDARPGEITFLANPKYNASVAATKASAIIVKPDVEVPDAVATVRCADPYGAVTAAIIRLHGYRKHPQWGIHERATVSTSAHLGQNANIGPYVTIADGVVIGKNATIYPGCYIADGATIGDDVTLFPNVVIYDGARIGNRVTIHAGSVIGEDGLGYAPVDGAWLKIPLIGSIVIEDDVEIGACCAMDRATIGETRIGRGSKFSNSVVIGHGTKVGEHCMIVAQVGVAGSTRIGNHVTLAGQVGVSGHLTIGDGARVGAKSGVHSNIEGGADYLGLPAVESAAFRRQSSLINRLPQMKQRLRDLEAEVRQLRESLEEHAKHEQ
ncbi:MAG: UDP-3-O-(3-hydroxymyristoyl)glucosamine N-acyltransferase [Phycisphaerae bacterium]